MEKMNIKMCLLIGLVITVICVGAIYGAQVIVGCDGGGVYLAYTSSASSTELAFTKSVDVGGTPSRITDDRKGNLYIFCDGSPGILKTALDGSGMETVIDWFNGGEGIEFYNGYLYWSVWGELPNSIKKAKEGSFDHSATLYTYAESQNSYDMAVDEIHSIIYWTESQTGIVEGIRVEGSDRHVIQLLTGVKFPRALHIDNRARYLYVASSVGGIGQIVKFDLKSESQSIIYTKGDEVQDLSVLKREMNDWLLFVEEKNGLKAIHTNGSEVVGFSYTGLGVACSRIACVHVIKDPGDVYYKFIQQFASQPINASFLDAFEKVASIFPSKSSLGVNDDFWAMYLYELKSLDNDFMITSKGHEGVNLTITKDFINSALNDLEGHLTVLSLNTSSNSTELHRGVDQYKSYILASVLVSVNLFDDDGDLLKHRIDEDGLMINFLVQLPPEDYMKPVCAFWNAEISMWSQEGSYTYQDKANDSNQICGFNHMTTFAVLFEFPKTGAYSYSPTVNYLVQICIAISILVLGFGLVCYAILWKGTAVNKDKILVHGNLTLAMIFAYGLTLGSTWAKRVQTVCLAVTIIRYNMFLSVFCCMFVEALHLYRMIVIVFGAERNLRAAYTAIGFGVPVLMTTITAAIGGDNLHDKERCWLTGSFVWAFIAPALAILAINLVILLIVMYKTLIAANIDDQDTIHSLKIGVRCALLLFPMMGVPWLFGFLGNFSIVVAYIFDFLSSLQGIYLVVVTCYINTEIRNALAREWRRRKGHVGNVNLRNINVQHTAPTNTIETSDEQTASTNITDAKDEHFASTNTTNAKAEQVASTNNTDANNEEIASTNTTDAKDEEIASTDTTDAKNEHVASTYTTDAKDEQVASTNTTDAKDEQVASTNTTDAKDEQVASTDTTDAKDEQVASTDTTDAKGDQVASTNTTDAKVDQVASTNTTDAKHEQVASTDTTNTKDVQVASTDTTDVKDEQVAPINTTKATNEQADSSNTLDTKDKQVASTNTMDTTK